MEYSIRKANEDDISYIMDIYASARSFMKENGNPNQWGDNYPSEGIIMNDIGAGNSYVIVKDGVIHGVFSFIIGEDKTYNKISDGKWLSCAPYGTIHRIASDGIIHGLVYKVVEFCKTKIGHLRIDTHSDNIIMQKAIKKCGFVYVGIISVRNAPRMAFELVN